MIKVFYKHKQPYVRITCHGEFDHCHRWQESVVTDWNDRAKLHVTRKIPHIEEKYFNNWTLWPGGRGTGHMMDYDNHLCPNCSERARKADELRRLMAGETQEAIDSHKIFSKAIKQAQLSSEAISVVGRLDNRNKGVSDALLRRLPSNVKD